MRANADLDGACARVKRALRRARFHPSPSSRRDGTRIDTDLKRGDGRLFVCILRHILCARSRAVASRVADRGHDLAGVESPLRFVERAFRATIDVFGYKPRASAAQFASTSGFAAVKMTTVLDVLAHVEAMELEMARERASSRRYPQQRRHSRDRRCASFERRAETRRDARRRRERESDDDDEDNDDDDAETSAARTVFVNPEYVEYVVDGSRERTRWERRERTEESSAVATLRVTLAEALGRLTRAESELAAVAARCDALESERTRDDDGDCGGGGAVEAREASTRGVATPSRESTEEFIARYVGKLRAASTRDEESDEDEDA